MSATKIFWRAKEVSPSGQAYHWNTNAETYYLIGEAMGEGDEKAERRGHEEVADSFSRGLCWSPGPGSDLCNIADKPQRSLPMRFFLSVECHAATCRLACLRGLPLPRQPAKLVVPDSVVFEPNVEYANPDGQHLQLDMARPKTGTGPFPAILCIHGGGFRAGTRQSFDGLCVRLADQGYVAVTVTYRLAPKYPFPAAVYDVKAAVRWLRVQRQ